MALSVDEKCLRLTDAEGRAGTLLGMRCVDCGVVVFGPATFCQSCSSQRLEEVELSSQGTLYSYTIVRVPPSGWPGPVPYALGEVELPEGRTCWPRWWIALTTRCGWEWRLRWLCSRWRCRE